MKTRQLLIRNLLKISNNVAIIQGDFNLHSSIWDELCYTETGTAGVNFYMSIAEENFQLINKDDEPTWFREGNVPRVLDLVFVNNVIKRQDIQDNLSLIDECFDHRMLSLKLRQGCRTRSGRPYIKMDLEEELAFIQKILSSTPYWMCLANSQEKSTKLMSVIIKAFEKNAKMPNPKSKPMLWWTEECNNLKDRYIKCPTKETRVAYYKEIKQAKKYYFGKKIDEMCENNTPWEGVRWTRDRPLSTIPRFTNKEGKAVTTMEDLWPILDNQFNSGSTRTTNINWAMINDLPSHKECPWYSISQFELQEAIKSTTNSSAPGYLQIPWQHIKILLKDTEFLFAITTFFNDILQEGVWPVEFKIVNTVVIPKPK
ncbi:hypothetical protein AX15_004460 [Amanita polypyramis BW_CC]|nr:hypothetical protein AX15_004460 [Amanita polypyramis BW_CC]